MLVARYTFEEGADTVAHDVSGNGHDAALKGSAGWTTMGRAGGALSLQGADPYLELPGGLVDGLDDLTIATWVNLSSLDEWSRIFDFGFTNGFMYLTPAEGTPEADTTGPLRFSVYNFDMSETTVRTAEALPINVWKHVAVTISSGTYTVWIDGAAVASTTPEPPNDVTPAKIGSSVNNYIGKSQFADPPLIGSVDDFRIYNYALPAEEIAALAAP
ncbi:uncharacterized protein SOCEGT47_043490 [Sorangium cellulosum]|uniref:LamG-like jellyroll fold domain-containing protein n=2 Tax=Sorangium cellulosum TaxID=56 RepID=A0A4P2Q3F7_SORCE|nr:uncharacterized protein SOCEGT47_043490 [Sorangium cellulosum]